MNSSQCIRFSSTFGSDADRSINNAPASVCEPKHSRKRNNSPSFGSDTKKNVFSMLDRYRKKVHTFKLFRFPSSKKWILSPLSIILCNYMLYNCWIFWFFPQMSRLEHYMTFMKLPPELQLRISNYYQARYGGKWFDEKYIMDTISSSLKEVNLINTQLSLNILGYIFILLLSCCNETFYSKSLVFKV